MDSQAMFMDDVAQAIVDYWTSVPEMKFSEAIEDFRQKNLSEGFTIYWVSGGEAPGNWSRTTFEFDEEEWPRVVELAREKFRKTLAGHAPHAGQ